MSTKTYFRNGPWAGRSGSSYGITAETRYGKPTFKAGWYVFYSLVFDCIPAIEAREANGKQPY